MIKPGVLHTTHELMGHGIEGAEHAAGFIAGFSLPGFLEIGTLIGFLGIFMYFTLNRLAQANLVPERDPYLAESLHHHV
jgi:hypothetical protein